MNTVQLRPRAPGVLLIWAVIASAPAEGSPPTAVTITERPSSGEAAGDHFVLYRFPQDGFEARFPSKPTEYRTDKGKYGFVNSYQALVASPISQYSIFVDHGKQRVFDAKAIDEYLEGLVVGLARPFGAEARSTTKKLRYLGFPAIEYSFNSVVEGHSAVNRGVIFIVDGDHIRLSQIYVRDERSSEAGFRQLIESFRLIPIEASIAAVGFSDPSRGITFSVPTEWVKSPPSIEPVIVAEFHNLGGHAFSVKDSGVPSYSCTSFQRELSAHSRIESTESRSIRGRRVEVIKTHTSLPQYDVTLLEQFYCWNTSRGAIVLEVAAPKDTFFRSQNAFETVAASMKLRE